MEKKVIEAIYAGRKMPYARAVVVGPFVFVAGMAGIDPQTAQLKGDVREQTRIALEKIKATLEEVGTSMDNIVRSTTYVKSLDYWSQVDEVRRQYYDTSRVAGTLVEAGLNQNALVEIEVMAVIPDKQK